MTRKIRNIKSIIIKNFQSHNKTILNLDEGVNVIVGPSDVGKTAILRALGWVFFNEPSGDSFIRMGEKEASVEIKFDDGYSVKRIRNKSFNGYHINHPDYEEIKKLSGFGSGVPDDVIEITGVKKFQITDDLNSSITYQTQLEGAFLLSQSKDKKAKAIGAISNVNVIDRALKLGKNYIKDYKREARESEEEIEHIDEKLKEFESLDLEKESLKNLDYIYKDILTLEEKKEKLTTLLSKLNNVEDGIKEEKNLINNLKFIPEATNEFNDVNLLISHGASLNRMFSMLVSNYKNINLNKNIIEKTNYIDKALSEHKIVTSLIKKYNILSNQLFNLKRVEEDILFNKKIVNETKDIDIKIKQFKEIEIISNKCNILHNLNNRLQTINYEINKISIFLDNENYQLVLNNYNYLINLISNYIKLIPLYKSLQANFEDVKFTKSIINNEQNVINDSLLKYIEFLKESKICPLCGAELNEEHINKIMEEYKYEL